MLVKRPINQVPRGCTTTIERKTLCKGYVTARVFESETIQGFSVEGQCFVKLVNEKRSRLLRRIHTNGVLLQLSLLRLLQEKLLQTNITTVAARKTATATNMKSQLPGY
eukprot:scaffold194454_cov35-Cyclotella_meneghiniana.AAC.1